MPELPDYVTDAAERHNASVANITPADISEIERPRIVLLSDEAKEAAAEAARAPVETLPDSDRGRFLALLDDFGIGYEQVGTDVQLREGDHAKVTGYSRFLTIWTFTREGLSTGVEVWE